MNQKKKKCRKVISYALALVMVFSTMTGIVPFMDTSMTVKADSDKIVSGLGTSAIKNPTSTGSSAEAWAGSYVYYGKYDGTSPTKYRVLDRASNDFGVSGGSLLLECDTTLYNPKFDDSNNTWSSSSLRSGLQGDAFLNKSGVFTEQEKGAIASSTKNAAAQNDGEGDSSLNWASLSSDTVFVLDAKEATRSSYGYATDKTRMKSSGGASADWWLRSPGKSTVYQAGQQVYQAGYVYYRSTGALIASDSVNSTYNGVSPAFNINLSSVIFASAISGQSGSYKLTLKDDKMSIALTSGQKVTKSGDTLTIPYTVIGDNAGNANQVSVLVTDKAYTDANATIKKYGKLATDGSFVASGTGTFALPGGLTGTLGTDYHIYLLAEDVNGEKETDYANLKEITAGDIGVTTKDNLVYNGSEQDLVEAPEGSNYLYSLTGADNSFNATIPKGKNADTYTVYYKETAGAVAKNLTAKIAKKEVTVDGIAVSDKVYDGTTSAVLDYTNVTYKKDSADALVSGDTLTVTATGAFADANVGDSKSITISNITLGGASAGNYTLAASGNQSSATGKITKKPVTVTAKAQTVDVNGTIQIGVSEAELSGAVDGHTLTAVTLTAGNVTTVGSSIVTPSNATIQNGNTDVTSNYEITYTAGTLTVIKAQPKLKSNTTLTAGSLTYGETLADSQVTGTMVDKYNEATEVAGTFAWKEPETKPQVSDSGVTEYDVLFTPTNDNYCTVGFKVKLTVNKAKAVIKTEPAKIDNLTYDGSAQKLVTAGATDDGTIKYALTTADAAPADEAYTYDNTNIPAGTYAGTYYVWYKVIGDANHNDSALGFVEAKINPVDKKDLNNAIEKAEAYYNTIKDNSDYSKQKEALGSAISTAKLLVGNDNATAAEVSEGITAVNSAKTTAETAVEGIIESNKEAFATEKTTQKNNADSLAEDGDSDASRKLIEDAKKAIDELAYDDTKSLDEDKVALAAIVSKLKDELTAKRAEENKAAKELEAGKQEAQAAMNELVTVTQNGNKFTVKWTKSSFADGYYVYASYCGKKATKPTKTIKKNTTTKTTITKINGKKINQKKNFHVYVVPYKIIDGKNVILGKSTVAHVVGAKNTKYSNVKKLTLTKKKYIVKVGKTAKIKAKVTLVNKNKKHIPKSHGAKFRYKSSDTSIATVDKNGKIKGIKKGTCTIYVYSINGLTKKAQITVK